jgi:hypothetical protein
MVGTVEVDRIAGQVEGGLRTNNVTMRNQLLGMQCVGFTRATTRQLRK